MKAFKFDRTDLAKALNVTPYTVDRWLKPTDPTFPTGLQKDVLQGLYNTALEVNRRKDEETEKLVRGLITLGIGALLFYLLTKTK
ncbi:MAG: hypothetical protein ACM3YF_01825 [Candidatus Zixiibacteriota bacterium]